MKKLILMAVMLSVGLSVLAIPARRRTTTLKASDGSTITAMLRGDENFHYYSTKEGKPLMRQADGTYREATVFEAKNMQANWSKKLKARNDRRAQRLVKRRLNDATTGEKKGLVILVNFKDVKLNAANTRSEFDDMFNKKGYSKNQHIGSVRDYFYDQSYGQLAIDFDVVGPYTLSQNMAYYGANDENGDDARPGAMIAEACQKADNDVDFRNYDWNGDGEVEQVYVIYAGYSESSSEEENTIWPHEWDLYSSDFNNYLTLDQTIIDIYACSSELWGYEGTRMDGIGSAVHEFSHCLGLPDAYDTSGAGNFGMDSWSVLDYGSYNGPYYDEDNDYQGSVPAPYTAYERMFCGWIEPTVLERGCKIEGMKPITEAKDAYIIYNDANENEFYLLENHQLTGWDTYAYGHGLLITHIDYDEYAWYMGTVNNEGSHQRYTIVPADGTFATGNYWGYTYATVEDLEGDPYPGTTNNTALTDTSKPAATLFTAAKDGRKFLGRPIENIAESQDGLISFSFMGGVDIDAPVANESQNATANGFKATWSAVEGAESYTIQLISVEKNPTETAETTLLEEDFSLMNNSAESAEVTTDNEAGKMHTTGWYYNKVFEAVGKVRLGSSKYGSEFATPYLQTSSGTVTVSFREEPYKTDVTTIGVWILDGNDEALMYEEVEATGESHTLVFEDVPETFCVDFYVEDPKCRYYLDDIKITTGGGVKKEVTTITGITSTDYTFQNLDFDHYYTYQVQACAGEGASMWSNSVAVDLAAGIKGTLMSDDMKAGNSAIYNLMGQKIVRPQGRGIFIQNGKKYLVK